MKGIEFLMTAMKYLTSMVPSVDVANILYKMIIIVRHIQRGFLMGCWKVMPVMTSDIRIRQAIPYLRKPINVSFSFHTSIYIVLQCVWPIYENVWH